MNSVIFNNLHPTIPLEVYRTSSNEIFKIRSRIGQDRL